MGKETKISWTDHTFSPWIGCSKVAPECEHCYAVRYAHRFGVEWGPHGTRRRTSPSNWREPLKWDAAAKRDGVRRRVFCASLADVFEDRPELIPWREKLFWLIELCDGLDWLLLTKRPENMVRMAPEAWADGWPRNVWAGTTAGTQRTADRAIPLLLDVPAAVWFVSCEPLIEAVDLSQWVFNREEAIEAAMFGRSALSREQADAVIEHPISWVIAGGESGPHARPCNVEWIRSIVRQCKAAAVPVFVKQLGRFSYADKGGRDFPTLVNDSGSGSDPAEWPTDLQVREFPR